MAEFHYRVLYIRDVDQHRLLYVLDSYLEKERGETFIPYMEYYRRGEKKNLKRPIFPGYVFLYTNLSIKDVHILLSEHRRELNAGLRELSLREYQKVNGNFLEEPDERITELPELNEEEEDFIGFLKENNGLLGMSIGYEENHHYIVMEGPLKKYEKKIKKVDKHNRKAFLEFEINGNQAIAGFECKPKGYWFPKGDEKIVTLSDGTEIDLRDLEKSVMTIR